MTPSSLTGGSDGGGAMAAWWRCTASADSRFTVGVAYEVYEYDRDGRAVITTDNARACATLPVPRATFVPHDPWAKYRASLATPTPEGEQS